MTWTPIAGHRDSTGSFRAGRGVVYLLLVIIGVVYAAPLVWMVSTSAKPSDQTMVREPRRIVMSETSS